MIRAVLVGEGIEGVRSFAEVPRPGDHIAFDATGPAYRVATVVWVQNPESGEHMVPSLLLTASDLLDPPAEPVAG